MGNKRLIMMIEASFFAAFALILDLLPSIKLSPSISISFAMVPILIIAFRWGFLAATASGFIWGLLQIAMGDAYILTPLQGFIEYFLAFAFIGFAGLFMKKIQVSLTENKKKALQWIIIATFVGSAARYFWHFIAGFLFWGEYAPEGMSPLLFSLGVNGGTMIGAAIYCSVILFLLVSSSPRFLLHKRASSSETMKKIS
jgi:thiamine transporter